MRLQPRGHAVTGAGARARFTGLREYACLDSQVEALRHNNTNWTPFRPYAVDSDHTKTLN